MAYHPSSNGLVDRQNRKIIQHLRTLVGDVSTSWHKWMPQVLASLNSSLHKTIGDTPHFIVFGQDKKLSYSILLKKEDPVYNFDDYVRLRTTDFQKIYRRVQANSDHTKTCLNEQQWTSASEKVIVIGDIVYLKVHEPKNKLTPPFKGPYRVIDYDQGNKVKIRHLTTHATQGAHLDHLKRTARSPYTDEETDVEVESSPPDMSQADRTANADSNEYHKKFRSYKGERNLTLHHVVYYCI